MFIMKKLYHFFWGTGVYFLFAFAIPNQTEASHAVGADLKYEWLGGLNYKVTFAFYRDCAGISAPGSVSMCYTSVSCNLSGSGTLNQIPPTVITPLCPQLQTVCTGGPYPGIEQYLYIGTITLPAACSDWIFSWGTCCRNMAINTGPTGASFYVEAFLNNVAAPNNSSPFFSNLPVPFV